MLILLSAILGMFFIIILIAVRFGKALNKRLATLTFVINKVEQQELDFEISVSGIKEVDAVLHSMDHMRRALKDSLERQWEVEQGKNRPWKCGTSSGIRAFGNAKEVYGIH